MAPKDVLRRMKNQIELGPGVTRADVDKIRQVGSYTIANGREGTADNDTSTRRTYPLVEVPDDIMIINGTAYNIKDDVPPGYMRINGKLHKV